MTAIRSPRGFWTGVLYVAFGGAVFGIARGYGMGVASQMGSGYLPTVLAVLLVLIGIVSLVRSFLVMGEPIGKLALRPGALVLGATLLFGFLLPRAGLLVALIALVLISASASEHFRFERKAVAGMAALVAFCALVFVKGLGVPMPLLGPWFGG